MQKTNFKTRLLALLTAMFMLVMCVPFAAFAEEAKNVTVQVRFYIDGTMTEPGDGGLVSVEAPESDLKAGKINVPEDKIPAGYEIAETKPVLTYVSMKDMWFASVYVKEKTQEPTQPETVTVKVRFIDKDTGAWLNDALIDVEAPKSEVEAGAITIPADQIPADYEVVEQKVFTNETYGWMASVYVKKPAPVQPETVTVKVRFIDKDTGAWLNDALIDVEAPKSEVEAGAITIPADKIPADYEVVEQKVFTNATYGWMASVYVKKSAPVQPETVTVKVRFIDKDTAAWLNDTLIDVEAPKSEVEAGAITIPADKIPADYEVVEQKVFTNATYGWMASVYVKKSAPVKPETVTVKVRFIDTDTAAWLNETLVDVEAPKSEVEAGAITIPADKIPAGYEVVEQKVFTNATYGWMASVYVKKSAPVKPETVTITVNMFDEANGAYGKPVKTYTVITTKDAKSITIDEAEIPTGYVKGDCEKNYVKNLIGGKDDYVAFWIKKDAKAPEVADIHVYVKSSNNDLGTVTEKNIMLTKSELTGAYKDFALKATAKDGYHLTGWTVTADGKNVATVKADATSVDLSAYAEAKEIVVSANFEKNASNNNNNSSSSSSSSNKTTTASNKAAEQKVVKAAAAPANTTKVLPKTGASNVAPLLGGSLAVVALLMGYGVYSLVLRKKD